MTSEICVMNRRSLVLAADSAVTVSRWEGGQKEERYFKGANKIFQLSETEPIGIMIYDSADLHRVPWEIIVKTFRKHFGKTAFPTVKEYALEFFKFVENHRELFPIEHLDQTLIENVDQIMIRCLNTIKDDAKVKAAADDSAAVIARNEVLQDLHSAVMALPLKFGFDDEAVADLLTQYGDLFRAEAAADLKLFLDDQPLDIELLVEVGLQTLFRRPEAFQSETGIVIAGFGTKDFFPSFVEFSCWGFLAHRLSHDCTGDRSIDRRDSGFFKTFATTAMTDTFTMGFGPDVYGIVKNHLKSELYDFAAKISADTGHSSTKVDELVADAVRSHTKKWTEEVFEKHGRPLRRVIGSLPIDELASLAETLVMLESLKEKVTQPSESVGGPIDVAIITKHEGFVWAKRKLYFEPRLNPRYFLRQKQDAKAEGAGDVEAD